jgi:hypothetical protein
VWLSYFLFLISERSAEPSGNWNEQVEGHAAKGAVGECWIETVIGASTGWQWTAIKVFQLLLWIIETVNLAMNITCILSLLYTHSGGCTKKVFLILSQTNCMWNGWLLADWFFTVTDQALSVVIMSCLLNTELALLLKPNSLFAWHSFVLTEKFAALELALVLEFPRLGHNIGIFVTANPGHLLRLVSCVVCSHTSLCKFYSLL